ncbi:DNA integration/recombination/invertion protein [Oceanobacillus picturae]|uniref:DNA integration/recombination/invertion protein n=1 Tax=Oceanobacillus picturae TaxID=171693 RepID=A0A0U9H9N9_9BACI|nr:tyrosine-type recombinase/integrase [Oceanobacillus picturae]GAQ18505.1 DNA integration/recombination/invertion protein [Oceanobacillus picturae]
MSNFRRRGVVKRRDAGIKYEISRHNLHYEKALENAIRAYEAENYRPRTISDYRKNWREFFEVIGKENVFDVTREDFRRYITQRMQLDGLAAGTINIRLGGVKSVFSRLVKDDILKESPGKDIPKLRTDENTIFAFSESQLKRLFSIIDKTTVAGYRDYVAMITMLYCGLRGNEIDSLEIKDVDLVNSVIMLPGSKNKNRKVRAVPMKKSVQEELRQLIIENQGYFGEDITHVFVNSFGEPLKHGRIRKRMHKYGESAGLNDEARVSPHSLRHTFAVRFLMNGGDIRTLQMLLGHADLSTTQVYLRYSTDNLVKQYNRASENDNLDL